VTVVVAADLRWPAGTGIGLVQRELLGRMPPSLRITDLGVKGRIGSPLSPLKIARCLRGDPAASVFWSPGFLPPLYASIPVVVTVHDLTHLHYYSKLHQAYYSVVLRPLYRRCARIICVSRFTREEFLQWSGVDPDRVCVIYNGLSDRFKVTRQTGANGSSEEYILYPGNRRFYKNLRRLIEGFSRSCLPRRGICLMLTGNDDAEIRALAAKFGVEQRIRFSGFLEEGELVRLYCGARALAYVSLYEGFGLPIVEAMGLGVPVLCSNVSSLPEVAGGAACLVDPLSVADIARGLELVTFDAAARAQLIAAGRKRAADFDWKHAASETWKVVEGAARAGVEG
jgi:glycosyltransferase involved in cell wall biosynthesis